MAIKTPVVVEGNSFRIADLNTDRFATDHIPISKDANNRLKSGSDSFLFADAGKGLKGDKGPLGQDGPEGDPGPPFIRSWQYLGSISVYSTTDRPPGIGNTVTAVDGLQGGPFQITAITDGKAYLNGLGDTIPTWLVMVTSIGF